MMISRVRMVEMGLDGSGACMLMEPATVDKVVLWVTV